MSAATPHLRPWAMRLHRWVALAVGAWFALLGLSGSVLVWHGEIDRGLNPQWFAPLACAAPSSEAPVARALEVHARHAQGKPTQVMAPAEPGAAFVVWTRTGDGARLQHFIDVGCARYLGHRQWGAVRLDRAHLVPALYELHRSILSGEVGHVVVGFVGLLLLFVAVTGLVTAWPRHATGEAWKRTLTLKRGAATRRKLYDLHRATGMWMALFLLLMSVTGAYLCFPRQGRALVAAVLPTGDPAKTTPVEAPAAGVTAPDAVVANAQRLWKDARWSRVQLPANPDEGIEVRLMQAGEIRMDTGDTRVKFDVAGNVSEIRDPLRAPPGDRLISWLFPLHSGEALGLAGRMAWFVFGTVPPLMFATGLWLWWQRRKAKAHAYEGHRQPHKRRKG